MGLFYINDIVKEGGELMGWDEMKEILEGQGHFLQQTAVIKAIPRRWKIHI
jgi:hypothetical protein